MFELGLIITVITLIYTCITNFSNDYYVIDDLKNIALCLIVGIIFSVIPFITEPRIRSNNEYISDKIHQSKFKSDIEFSQPVFVYEFIVDRPFTWLGDGKLYKIAILQSNKNG
jgi:hypothetical protein